MIINVIIHCAYYPSSHLLRAKQRKSGFFLRKCFSSRASRMTEFSREARDLYKPYKFLRRENTASLPSFTDFFSPSLQDVCLTTPASLTDEKNTGLFCTLVKGLLLSLEISASFR